MPNYVINIDAQIPLSRKELDRLEDVVYDVLVDEFKASYRTDEEGIGFTDVAAEYN